MRSAERFLVIARSISGGFFGKKIVSMRKTKENKKNHIVTTVAGQLPSDYKFFEFCKGYLQTSNATRESSKSHNKKLANQQRA